jgi:hypothetical protein
MARSKQVYTIVGLMVLDAEYRNEFFVDPHAAANKLVGSLTTDELTQVMRIAGEAGITGVNKSEYVRDVKDAFGTLYSFLKCPSFPCPEPDPFDA